ncbi:MAG TPA: VIT and VWA domain-containing protein [Bryobacteraceae bacterium]|nr:VIT and VWA domain-containing protein [Bryobacteraceae bacterium]
MRLILFLLPALLWAEAGVLIPTGANQPDPSRLALAEMEIRIRIDNQHAVVDTRQIFANRDGLTLEGTYTFTLPGAALVSNFAVWDDVTRIPGVILERRRAEEIYNVARAQAIDPGVLQQGERDLDEARRTSVFSARIVPIPAWGTKRVEMQYQERLPVENFESFFAVPLRPDAYRAMTAGRLSIQLEIASTYPITDFIPLAKTYPLQVQEKSAHRIRAGFSGNNVTFTEDFAVRYRLDAARADSLSVLAYRDGVQAPGYFEASALLARGKQAQAGGPPRTVIALFDNSLSMQWEKLERSFLALERLLRSLKPADRFLVALFNSRLATSTPKPVPASQEAVEAALDFVSKSALRGGTDMQAALREALARTGPETFIVLLTDGNPTQGATIRNAKISAWYTQELGKLGANRPRTSVFAVGDDANAVLLRRLVGDSGVFEWVRSTEPADFKLNAFLSKLDSRPVERLGLTASPSNHIDLVYPLQETAFGGSVPAWTGRYRQPGRTSFTVAAARGADRLKLSAAVNLPARDTSHAQLPRTWAKARVDALLDKIDREGEDRASIDEIIRLAREFKFVTPYTSFLAAPRSLLRPRLIRPGDPVLRVRTDESITSVVAIFPFGLVKPLRYLKDEDIWQTRFLAPADLPDGTHSVRLILRDRQGRAFRESKTFVIASKPPQVRVKLERPRARRGEAVRLRVYASETSRTIVARMYGAAPVILRWSPAESANTGDLIVSAHLPAGTYPVEVTAEDFAHNVGRQEVKLEVLP